MNWFQAFGIWACKLKVEDGRYKTLSSGVKATEKGIRWDDEKKSVKTKAEKAINNRIANEGFETLKRPERTFDEVVSIYKNNFNYEPYIMKSIEREFEGHVLEDISPLDIRRYHNRLLERCKPTTWNRHRSVLNAIFNRAIEWGFCNSNPVTSVKRYPDTKVNVFLSKEHSEGLLSEAKKEDFYLFSFIQFALKTGRRRCEILALEWEDVDFGNEVIHYRIRKKRGGVESHRRKPPKSVFHTLFALRRVNKDKPFPFYPRKGWRRIRNKVDKEMVLPDKRFHALRHRCATELIENGATLYDVQHYLCHSDPSTTMIYAHVGDKRDEKIAAFLE